MQKAHKTKFHFYVDSEAAWECIENGKAISSLYPDYFKPEIQDTKYHNHMKSILLPGEKYILLDDKMYDYAVTSYGRVINCIHGTQVFVYFRKENVMITMRSTKQDMQSIFKKQKWNFNVEEIINNYNKYKWKKK